MHYEVIEQLTIALKKATKDDLVLLYYSGHGLPNNKNDLYLSTINTSAELLEATAIPFEQIYRLINTFYCKKIVIILDCCYSGAAGNVFKGDIASHLKTLNDKVTGTFLITASSNDQVAQEKTKGNYSLFTSHLIEGLETGEADKDGDGLISIDELFRYVYKKVVAENPTQIPKRFLKNETGELIIAKSGRDSRNERAKKIRAYFFKLVEEERIDHDILTSVLEIIARPVKELSSLEKEKDNLIGAVFENKDAVGFIKKWEQLAIKVDPDKSKIKLVILIAVFIGISAVIFGIWKSFSDEPVKNTQLSNTIAAEKAREDVNAKTEAKTIADTKAAEDAEAKRLADAKQKAEQDAEAKRIADAKAAQEAEAKRLADAKAKAEQEAEAKALAKQQAETARQQAIAEAKNILRGNNKTQWPQAVSRLKKLEPLDSEAMLLLGGSYAKEKNYRLACQWFKKAAAAGNQEGVEFANSKKCR